MTKDAAPLVPPACSHCCGDRPVSRFGSVPGNFCRLCGHSEVAKPEQSASHQALIREAPELALNQGAPLPAAHA